jgi:hypothetical protein
MSINEPKKKRGRPTTFKEEYIEKIDEYLLQCEDEETAVLKSENLTTGYKGYEKKLKVNLPTIEGYSMYINVPLYTIYTWRDKHPDFKQALELINAKQKQVVTAKGLSNEYNSTIAKLILSSNHGMSERTDSNVNVQVTGIDIAIQE